MPAQKAAVFEKGIGGTVYTESKAIGRPEKYCRIDGMDANNSKKQTQILPRTRTGRTTEPFCEIE